MVASYVAYLLFVAMDMHLKSRGVNAGDLSVTFAKKNL